MSRSSGALLLVAAVAFLLVCGTGGMSFRVFLPGVGEGNNVTPEPAFTTTGFNLYVLGDLHWSFQAGIEEYGRRGLVYAMKYINADPYAAGLIVTGDFNHACFTGWEGTAADKYGGGVQRILLPQIFPTAAESINFIDSVNIVLRDTLTTTPVYPILGNWEVTRLKGSGPGTTSSGIPYDATGFLNSGSFMDDFTRFYPEVFAQFNSSPNDRGRRHYGLRLRTRNGLKTNILLFTLFGMTNIGGLGTEGAYEGNAPSTGFDPNSRFGASDFDGYHDSTSAQRVDLRQFLASHYTSGDWLLIGAHRPFKSFHNSVRVDDDSVWSPGHGLANWMKSWLTGKDIQRYFVLSGDTHENLWFKHPTANYLQVHSTVAIRQMLNKAQMADSGYGAGEMLFFSYRDTASTAAMEAIRAAQPIKTWITLTRMHFQSANEVKLDAICIYMDGAYAVIDSPVVASKVVRRDL